jgi:hypothetical protein
MPRLAAGVAVLAILFPPQATPPTGRMTLGEVLLFTTPTFEPGADPKASAPLLAALAAERSEPGVAAHLFSADRGSRKGQYAMVRAVDTLKRRQAMPLLDGRGNEGVEYHLVAPETVGTLPEVDVLGLHYTRVRPDRIAAFERFVRSTLHPAVGNLRPDLRILYYRDANAPGSYVALFALIRSSRDKYWPGGADSDELRSAFKPVQGFTAELQTYLVEGSYLADPKFAAAVYESRDWSDFVLVSQNAR